MLRAVAGETRTLVAYEAPHRVRETLDDIAAILGDRPICVARELTKLYEEFVRGTVSQAREHFAVQAPRGEFTIVLAGQTLESGAPSEGSGMWDDARVLETVRNLIETGLTRTQAVKRVARISGRDRQEIYQLTISPNN